MPSEWLYLCIGVIILSVAGFVCMAVLWLRKLRESVIASLSEVAEQQIRSAQRTCESIAQIQKQQDTYNQQIHSLAQAGLRLQQEISSVSNRLSNTQSENVRGGQTLH
ncbi:MAG: hypothetical protein WC521_01285 [Bdellovibrionales bacterium]